MCIFPHLCYNLKNNKTKTKQKQNKNKTKQNKVSAVLGAYEDGFIRLFDTRSPNQVLSTQISKSSAIDSCAIRSNQGPVQAITGSHDGIICVHDLRKLTYASCFVLFRVVLFYFILFCFALFCFALFCFVMFVSILFTFSIIYVHLYLFIYVFFFF